MRARLTSMVLACGLATACSSGPDIAGIPSVSNNVIPSPEIADAQNNATHQPAVQLNAYPNPWGLSLDQQPNVFSRSSGAGYVYKAPDANVPLYGDGGLPTTADVVQVLGNSAFMGALATLADRVPGYVHTGIRYVSVNGDGSRNYLVRLYGPSPSNSNFTDLWVPTDDRVPTDPNGGVFGASGTVLWAGLYQKAYAKLDSVTHQNAHDPNVTGYDTQEYSGNGTGLAALTGLGVTSTYNTGARDANSQAVRDTFNTVLNGVNGATVVVGSYMLTANDLPSFPEYNSNANSATLDSGSTLTPSPNAPNLYCTLKSGARIELIAGMEYSVLAAQQDQVLIRNTWASDGTGAGGYIWLPRVDFLRLFATASVVTPANNVLGTAASPDAP